MIPFTRKPPGSGIDSNRSNVLQLFGSAEKMSVKRKSEKGSISVQSGYKVIFSACNNLLRLPHWLATRNVVRQILIFSSKPEDA